MNDQPATASDTSETILVRGASGYVEGRLVPLPLVEGYRVKAAARNPQQLKARPWACHANDDIGVRKGIARQCRAPVLCGPDRISGEKQSRPSLGTDSPAVGVFRRHGPEVSVDR